MRTCRQLLCDASQIQQVVLNLVLNAAEASQGKAERSVEVRTGHDEQTRSLVLSVVDNGEGIPEANLPKLFDPFFTTKSEGKGSGWAWLWCTGSCRRTGAT